MHGSSLFTRAGRAAVVSLVVASVTVAGPALAQAVTTRVFAGAAVPSGALKDQFGAGGLAGAQLSVALNDHVGVSGTMWWGNAPTRRVGDIPDNATSWEYDAGVEGRLPGVSAPIGSSWRLTPFAGAGIGSRAYLLAKSISGSETSFAGYGALGADLVGPREGHLGVRLEAREYQASATNVEQTLPRTKASDMTVFFGVAFR